MIKHDKKCKSRQKNNQESRFIANIPIKKQNLTSLFIENTKLDILPPKHDLFEYKTIFFSKTPIIYK